MFKRLSLSFLLILLTFIYCSLTWAGSGYPVSKTGQTTSYGTGDDGDWESGTTWPDPRFTDNYNGTVRDNLTGLIWLKNASCFGEKKWDTAISDANGLANGNCNLSDGSSAGDWRLPTIRELCSLIDRGEHDPALPSGRPFSSVKNSYYWSSTPNVFDGNTSWYVELWYGTTNTAIHSYKFYVWPVRDAQ